MLRIYWNTSAEKYGDHEIEEHVINIIQLSEIIKPERSFQIRICQSILLDRIRLAVKDGLIDYKNIIFIFDDKTIKVDRNGTLEDYPTVLDIHLKILLSLAVFSKG